MLDFNQQVIAEFRANRGRVGGPFEGARLLLLTTTGARTGAPHTTPLGYLPDGERVVVIASAGGSPQHPDWFHNLVAAPRVRVETGVFTYEAEAEVLVGQERERLFARAVESDPGWGEYQVKAGRELPVVALREVAGGPPEASSFGEGLRLIHDAFRRELALVREEVARSGPGLGVQLRVNCLTVCQGLRYHHDSEESAMLPTLAHRYPELTPVVERLRQEHVRIAALLDALQGLVTAEGADARAALPEVDRLIGELEGHLAYEEEQLIPVLDAFA